VTTKNRISGITSPQQWGFIILRFIIGWHFLYEGIVKITDPNWTAKGFLMGSKGFLSETFQWMASQPNILEAINFLNAWGLFLIGLGLFLGLFARAAVYAGILLLFFYYIAYPPFQGFSYGIPREGNYLIINKNFIEMATLVLLALFPKTLNIGVWGLLKKININLPAFLLSEKQRAQPANANANTDTSKNRRDFLKHLAFLPFLGGFTWAFVRNKGHAGPETDAITGTTITLNQSSLDELEEEIPRGKLGNKMVSRVIFGNNLIGGWAHARDLLYVSQLFKAYNSESKVFESLQLAENAGINTMNLISNQMPLINRYKKMFDSQLQTMVQAGAVPGINLKNIREDIDKSIDLGVDFVQIWGVAADTLAYEGKLDVLQKCVDHAKRQGYPTGIGAHDIHTFLACDEAGIEPDFYFKTLHHDKYRSSLPKKDRAPFKIVGAEPGNNPLYDNMWCLFPDKTIEYIQNATKPVFGYKVLAAGAIPPEEGFQYAFDNGADFICVGMFDFQIVENAKHTIRCIKKAKYRKRPWYG
jgi:uncharacterized membrane protein YphA (DoxX/SURF4 family)